MQVDWHGELIGQMEFYWDTSLRPRLDGLTDDEYLWEPTPGSWSVHPRPDGTATIDWAYPEPSPPPLTTIAWRICHIAGLCFALRTSNHFGHADWTPDRTDWPTTAGDGIDYLEQTYTAWRDAIKSAGPVRLTERTGDTAGPYAEYPFATLVLHINRELMHHGGEIGLMRDFYRMRKT